MKKSEVIKEGELEGMKRAYELIAEKLEPIDTTTDELGKKLLTVLKLRNPREHGTGVLRNTLRSSPLTLSICNGRTTASTVGMTCIVLF